MLMSGPQYQSSSSKGRGRGRVAEDSSPFHNRPGAVASHTDGAGKVDRAQPLSESASLGTTKQGSPRLGGRGRARPRKPELQLYVPRGRRDQEGQSSSKPQTLDSSRALGQDSRGTPGSDSFKTSGQDSVRTPGQCILRTSEQESSTRSPSQRASKPTVPASSRSSKKSRADAQIYVPRGRRKVDEDNMLEMSNMENSSHLSSPVQISAQNESVEQQNHAVHLEQQNGLVCVDVDATTSQSSANTNSDHHQPSMITDIDSSDKMTSQHIRGMDMEASNQDHFENCAFPVSASIPKSDQYFQCNSETISSFTMEHENKQKSIPKTMSAEENVMSDKCVANVENLEDQFSPDEENLIANTHSESEFLHTVPPPDAVPPQADADMEFSSVYAEEVTKNSPPSLSGEISMSDSKLDEHPFLSEQSERQVQEDDKEMESVMSGDGCLNSAAEMSAHLTSESTTRLKEKDESEMCNNVKLTVGEAIRSDEEHKDVDHSSQVGLSQTASSSICAPTDDDREDTQPDSKLTDSGNACSPGAFSSTKAGEEEEDEDSWDKLFDDSGDCLDPTMVEELTACVGEVEISQPKKTINYLDYQPKEPSLDMSAYSHVIEISDFPPEFQTRDLFAAFKDYMNRGFDLKWVDDTHALGVFSSTIAAMDALKMVHPMMKLKPLSEGSKQSRSKASRIQEFLQPYKARPVTSAAAARRLVTGALGMTPRITKEQRAEERRVLKEARDKKRQDRKQKEAIWDGDIGKCAMDNC